MGGGGGGGEVGRGLTRERGHINIFHTVNECTDLTGQHSILPNTHHSAFELERRDYFPFR